jgi:hypothetical protein
MDSRTTVYPLWVVGQDVRAPGAGAVVVDGGGFEGVEGGPGVVETDGSVTVAVSGAVVGIWTGPPCVATSGSLCAPASLRTIAAVAPAVAITSPSATRQNQPPGYQPKRSCHAEDNRPSAPAVGSNRYPHSRQYS